MYMRLWPNLDWRSSCLAIS